MGLSRRASPGHVRGCPGCHDADKERPKDDLCTDCRTRLDRANAIIAVEYRNPSRAWYQYAEASHWNPHYHTATNEIDGETLQAMHRAFHALVLACALDTLFVDSIDRRVWGSESEKLYRKHGMLIRRPKALKVDTQAYYQRVLLDEPTAEALNALDRAMCAALASSGAESYEKGANLLRSLASGDVTLDRFNTDTARTVKHYRAKARAALSEDEE